MLYALGKTHIPLIAQLGTALLLTVLARVTATRFGVGGLMMLTSPAVGYMTALGLFLVLYKRHQAFLLKEVLPFALHIFAVGVVSGWIAGQAKTLLDRASVPRLLSLGLVTAGGLAAGAGAFLSASLAWQVPEAVACSRYLRWRGDTIVRRMQSRVGL